MKETHELDDRKMIEIVVWNLQRYWLCTKEDGQRVLDAIISLKGHEKFMDYCHHDSPFAAAAMAHYLSKNNTLDGYGDWLIKNKLHQAPRESIEYFNRNYLE